MREWIRKARYRANEEGAAAIEFALVVPVAMLAIVGILEISLIMFADYKMEQAVSEISRQIRTGQASAAGMTQQQFKQYVCSHMLVLNNNCVNDLKVDVQEFPDFASVKFPPAVKEEQSSGGSTSLTLSSSVGTLFNIGSAESIIGVRVYYQWPYMTPFIANALNKISVDGKALLSAAGAFRNEPFN